MVTPKELKALHLLLEIGPMTCQGIAVNMGYDEISQGRGHAARGYAQGKARYGANLRARLVKKGLVRDTRSNRGEVEITQQGKRVIAGEE